MFWDQYVPHIQAAAGRCSVWGVAVLERLDSILDSLEHDEPSLHDKVLRVTAVIPAGGTYDLDKVPTNQAWTVEFVNGSAAWRINLNGSLLLLSTNGASFGGAPILLPGETATIVAAAGTEVTIQITRRFLEAEPRRARSGPGNEQWTNGSGPKHETARDVLDVGPYPHRREALVREN